MLRQLLYISFFFLSTLCFAQDQETDSLKKIISSRGEDSVKVNALLSLSKIYFNSDPEEAVKVAVQAKTLSKKINFAKGEAFSLKNIGIAFYVQGKYVDAINTWQQSLIVFDSIGDKIGVANIQSNLGAIFFNQGDDAKALEYYFQSLKVSEEINDTLRIATACINIGAVYFNKPMNHSKALLYYQRALPLSEAIDDKDAIGTSAVNLGEIYLARNNYDSALYYFEKSVNAYEGSANLPYSLIDMGKVYMKKGDYEKAIKYQTDALELAKKLDSKNDIAIALVGLAQTYQQQGDNKKALTIFKEAEIVAKETQANYSLRDIYQGLAIAYADIADFSNAFKYQNLLIAIKDTIYNIDTDKKLQGLAFNFEIEKKQSQINLLTKDAEIKQQELRRQKIVRNSFIGGFTIVLLFAGVFFTQRNRISKEKKRSDELLLNILPEETAEELKATGTAKAKSFDSVSVLFTDFKNFTQASERLSAEELVQEINYCYSEFDKIITKHGIEKIKTIGDAYMCAGGLPVSNATHPVDVVKAGIEMQQFIAKNKLDREAKGQPFFELRLGIHTGPVVAGIVGIKKFAYDIWGDTVNTASRMESSGEIGKVNISGSTYDLIKDKFSCIHRGKIQAKNKGEIDMYFVERLL